MHFLMQKIPFLIELIFNGSFILFYSLNKYQKLPQSWDPNILGTCLDIGSKILPFVIFFVMIVNYLNSAKFEDFFRKHLFSLIVFIPLLITWGDLEFCFWLSSIHLLSSILALYENDSDITPRQREESFLKMFKLQPAQIVTVTFAGLIAIGTSLLALPISSSSGKGIPLIDCLFMATASTCVTALSTISIQGDLSFFGQMVILVLVQVGGLGIMILYSSMTILLGRSMAMKERVIMQDILEASSLEELLNVIIDIIKYTFFIELWGAIVLTIAFTFEGFEFSKALYYGFFHSISAFCNSGLTLFDNNLESFATTPLIHGTISILITLGGLGFIVLKEIKTLITQRGKLSRLGLHSKVVLVTTALLTTSGTLMIFFGEFLNALDGYNLWEKLQISFFQSVTLRTAGFHTIPLTNLHAHILYLMSMLMFIGASPGSTGGGIKTSTLAVLIQSIRSALNGRNHVELFDRTIPNSTVVKTTAIAIISIISVTLFVFILMKIESDQTFLSIFFEVISAFGTVGLSLGITPYLSALGKFMIAIVMFVGRIGPLTLVLGFGHQHKLIGRFEYPNGRLMIG